MKTEGFEEPYGKLYNWHAVAGDSLCPVGWHIPSKYEWDLLIEYLGGIPEVGGKLKSRGTEYWLAPNEMGINSSGFGAFPGGIRRLAYLDPIFAFQGTQGRWWTKTEGNTSDLAWRYLLTYDEGQIYSDMNGKTWGLSVRCIRD